MTPEVLAVNVALVCPDATVTDPGTLAAELPLARETTTPEEPAGPLSVAVPVEELPPVTVEGFRLSDAREGGVIVRVAD